MAVKPNDGIENEVPDGLQPLIPEVAVLDEGDEVEVEIVDDPEVEEPAPEEAAAEPPPVEDAAAAEDTPVDEEFKGFKPDIQKRIQREIRIRRKAEEAANLAVQRLQEETTRMQTVASETAELRKNNVELQRQYAEVLAHAFNNQIEVKRRDLKAARDAGNFDDEQKIQGELDDLRFKHNQVQDMQRQLPTAEATAAAAAAATAAARPAAAAAAATAKPPNPLATRWVRDNASWFNNAKFEGHRAFALTEDAKLTKEGYDQGSGEYYKELDSRIDKAFPTLRRKSAAVKQPVAGVPAGGGAKNSGGNKITLTRADLEMMKSFNLDPSNKLHLREYARQLKASKETA